MSAGERTRPRVLTPVRLGPMTPSSSRIFLKWIVSHATHAQSVSARAPKHAREGACVPQSHFTSHRSLAAQRHAAKVVHASRLLKRWRPKLAMERARPAGGPEACAT